MVMMMAITVAVISLFVNRETISADSLVELNQLCNQIIKDRQNIESHNIPHDVAKNLFQVFNTLFCGTRLLID